ncbi:hypothetical protein ACWC2T_33555 [Streptomyces sp. NPDC001393]
MAAETCTALRYYTSPNGTTITQECARADEGFARNGDAALSGRTQRANFASEQEDYERLRAGGAAHDTGASGPPVSGHTSHRDARQALAMADGSTSRTFGRLSGNGPQPWLTPSGASPKRYATEPSSDLPQVLADAAELPPPSVSSAPRARQQGGGRRPALPLPAHHFLGRYLFDIKDRGPDQVLCPLRDPDAPQDGDEEESARSQSVSKASSAGAGKTVSQ